MNAASTRAPAPDLVPDARRAGAQHRIYLAAGAPRPGVPAHHGALVCGLPRLERYVQNRPVGPAPFAMCSETWFADRTAERAAFASAYYRTVVEPDECTFFDRGRSWNSVVLATRVRRPGPRAGYRLLVLGVPPMDGGCAGVYREEWLELSRPFPAGGRPCATSWWSDDRDLLEDVAATVRGTALVCTSHALRVAPRPADGGRPPAGHRVT